MWFGIALLSAVFFGLSGFFLKIIVHRNGSDKQFFMLLYLAGSIVLLYQHIQTDLSSVSLSWVIPVIGIIVVAIGSVFGNRAVSRAYAHGPASLTAPLVGSNVILVILASVLYYREHLDITQIIAVSLLIVAVSILSIKPNNRSCKLSITWWIMVLIAIVLVFSREMAIKALQELQAPVSFILMAAYFIGFAYFAALTLLEIRQKSYMIPASSAQQPKSALSILFNSSCSYGLLAGICSGLGLVCLSTAMQTGPASIVVPVFSLRSTIVVLLSFWLFKERLSKHQSLSLVLLIVAVLIIGMNS